MDQLARGGSDRAPMRGPVHHGPRLAHLGVVGLEWPAASRAWERNERAIRRTASSRLAMLPRERTSPPGPATATAIVSAWTSRPTKRTLFMTGSFRMRLCAFCLATRNISLALPTGAGFPMRTVRGNGDSEMKTEPSGSVWRGWLEKRFLCRVALLFAVAGAAVLQAAQKDADKSTRLAL